LIGTNLVGLSELKIVDSGLTGDLLDDPPASTNEAWIEIEANADLARGAYEISVKNTNSESSKVKLYIDDLPQTYEAKDSSGPQRVRVPVGFWGTLDPGGDADEIEFQAKAGQSLVFDVAARSIGSKAEVMLSLFDSKGALLASNAGFDGGDPLMGFQVPASGSYRLRIGERTDAGSKEHFYRVSIGSFRVVVAAFPLAVSLKQQTTVELIGLNLTNGTRALLKPKETGEMDLPVDPEKSRVRRQLK